MDFYLDSANLDEICSVSWFPIRGVTTNPTIVAKENRPFLSLMEELIDLKLLQIHAQVLADTTEEMVEEAKMLIRLSPGTIIPKIPVTPAGIHAIWRLAQDGYKITATGVFTVGQGLAAAKSGAQYIAPYINRIDQTGQSGVSMACELKAALETYNLPATILAASVKTLYQLKGLIEGGIQGITVQADFLNQVVYHPLTEQAVEGFTQDWLKTFALRTLDAPVKSRGKE